MGGGGAGTRQPITASQNKNGSLLFQVPRPFDVVLLALCIPLPHVGHFTDLNHVIKCDR